MASACKLEESGMILRLLLPRPVIGSHPPVGFLMNDANAKMCKGHGVINIYEVSLGE